MKERPILFSAPMVRAILNGSKTQTRRVVKPQPGGLLKLALNLARRGLPIWFCDGWEGTCPYGQPGDHLWVRETCRGWTFDTSGENVVRYDADGGFAEIENSREGAERWIDLYNYRGKRGAAVPSIHMPRWASRILLEIVRVRVERLQDISVGDCCAEGAPLEITHAVETWYRELWESINGKGSWDENPWVWVIEFKVVRL